MFDNVISGLKRSYPRDKMEEISTSFCFICLLHLANERGLKLDTGSQEASLDVVADIESRVGTIWDLKVGFANFSFLTSLFDIRAKTANRCTETRMRLQLHDTRLNSGFMSDLSVTYLSSAASAIVQPSLVYRSHAVACKCSWLVLSAIPFCFFG